MFKLARTLARDVSVDLDDSFRTKKALGTLGYLKPPDWGLTEYPNKNLFQGLERFQNDNGLKKDGIMLPNGPTARALGKSLGAGHALLSSSASDRANNNPAASDRAGTGKPNLPSGGLLGDGGASDDSFRDPITGEVRRIGGEPAAKPKPRAPFRLRGHIDPSLSVDLDDSLRTKRALNRLGYLQTPPFGITRYPNGPLFEALEKFQKDHGLRVDGVAKPEGPTEAKIEDLLKRRNVDLDADTDEDHPDTRKAEGLAVTDAPDNADHSAGTDGGAPPTARPSGDANPTLAEYQERIVRDVSDRQRTREMEKKAGRAQTPPVLYDEQERINSILNDTPARFDLAENPEASRDVPFYEDSERGRDAVEAYGAHVEAEAERQGVDPNLVKALLYAESARGHKGGLDIVADKLGISQSVRPMNIKPSIWGDLGMDKENPSDPKTNIKAGVELIKRIRDRIKDPTPAKTGSVWVYTGAAKTSDFGEAISRIYNEKPWEHEQ